MIATKDTILNLLGKQPYKERLLVDRQDTQDIIEAILNKHDSCTADYDKIAFLFDGGKVPQICERLFNFCKENLAYVVERTKAQYTSKPSTMLRRGHADCKGYALFCGGVLDALKRKGEKISWAFRFASYKLWQKKPYHVFIVVYYQGQEIYIDPVFSSFHYRKPALWLQDYVMTAQQPAAIAGMMCDTRGRLNVLSDGECTVGATTSQTGAQIMKIAPALAVVPVVGWIAGAAAEVIGGIVSIVGSKWNQSPDVRWLVQLYEYYAKGNAGATSDNKVSETDTQPAQAWFSVVLGVPIGGRKDFNILQSGDGNTNTPTNQTDVQRAQNYLNWKGLAGQVSLQDATNAADIAATMNPSKFPVGGWASRTAAPWVIAKQQAAAAAAQVPATSTSSYASLFQNKWLLFAIIGAGVLVIYEANKKPHHAKRA
jgi:hypothetical protein